VNERDYYSFPLSLGFFIIAQISKINPARTTIGARVILLKLKIFSLNLSGLSDLPPSISKKPIIMITNPIASSL
jgi:hypothetical protein